MKGWAYDQRLARDQEGNGGSSGTEALSAETTYECIVALVKKTADGELDKLMGALRSMLDSYGGTAADEPPPFHYGTCARSRAGAASAAAERCGPTTFFAMFPEARRIKHI